MGKCRAVVVRDAVERGRVRGGGSDEEAADLGKLSVFRYGFTQHMAARVLEMNEGQTVAVRTKLKNYVGCELVRVVSGHYHITEKGRGVAARMEDPAWFAVHHRAARAFMTSMTITRQPGMAEMEARRIEHVREAEYHCHQVMRFRWDESGSREERATWIRQKQASVRDLIYLNCCYDMSACQFLGLVATWSKGRLRSNVFWNEAQSDFVSLLEQQVHRICALNAGEVKIVEIASLLVKLLSHGIDRLGRGKTHFGLSEVEMKEKMGVFCELAVEKLWTECRRLKELGDREQRTRGMAWVQSQAENLVADCSEADGVIGEVDAGTSKQLLQLAGMGHRG